MVNLTEPMETSMSFHPFLGWFGVNKLIGWVGSDLLIMFLGGYGMGVKVYGYGCGFGLLPLVGLNTCHNSQGVLLVRSHKDKKRHWQYDAVFPTHKQC